MKDDRSVDSRLIRHSSNNDGLTNLRYTSTGGFNKRSGDPS